MIQDKIPDSKKGKRLMIKSGDKLQANEWFLKSLKRKGISFPCDTFTVKATNEDTVTELSNFTDRTLTLKGSFSFHCFKEREEKQ